LATSKILLNASGKQKQEESSDRKSLDLSNGDESISKHFRKIFH